jgi:type VI secretion system protein ImpK
MVLELEEILTIASRVLDGEPMSGGGRRLHRRLKEMLRAADVSIREVGYASDLTKLAVHAVTAFLDDAMKRSSSRPDGWPERTLQEDAFGDTRAGETFYDHANRLLDRSRSSDVADLMEVFQVCLSLGFEGSHPGDRLTTRSVLQARLEECRLEVQEKARAADTVIREIEVEERDLGWAMAIGASAIGVAVLFFVLRWILEIERARVRDLVQDIF